MFSTDVISKIDNYVYRLIDPRDFQTFYVGRGVGNRVFQHAKAELKHFEDDEDALTTKLQQIREIRLSGKEVICVIHRYGLTKEQAMEVESALIDCYPGLTNLVSGYGSDRGVITADDLQSSFERPIYEEPTEIDYIIVKTSNSAVQIAQGSLYDATRRAWRANLERASKVNFVLSVISGIVREVYEVDEWYKSTEFDGRIEFKGKPANREIANLFRGKLIPEYYRKQGMSSPFLYKKQ
ncbi:MAG: hypothetical protein IKA81_04180 [Alistipes sp.]|nr:hypothetical protein [Alistipes sp.]